MATELVEQRSGATTPSLFDMREWSWPENTYECHVLVCPDMESGGYTAHALRLPGVVSEGETKEEVLDAIVDAFRAAVQEYIAAGSIPWQDADVERTKDCFERRISVNV